MRCDRFVPAVMVLITLMSGCRGNSGDSRQDWEEYSADVATYMLGRKLEPPSGSVMLGHDTLGGWHEVRKDRTAVVFYVDLDCSVCHAKFKYWESFCKRFRAGHGIEAPVIAVVSSPDVGASADDIVNAMWTGEWICDTEGNFSYRNNMVDDRFQAVLVDSEDTIRLVGNPMFNEKLGELYEKTLLNNVR